MEGREAPRAQHAQRAVLVPKAYLGFGECVVAEKEGVEAVLEHEQVFAVGSQVR